MPADEDQTPDSIPLDAAPSEAAEEPEPDDKDPPLWVQQASLAEVLLWRMGIPRDREQVQREREQSENAVNLKPPITTRKVADAIANLSMQLMRGELDATTAKTNLYALQTLLTALRLQIIEEKTPKKSKLAETKRTRTKPRKPARRRKPRANRKFSNRK